MLSQDTGRLLKVGLGIPGAVDGLYEGDMRLIVVKE